MIRWLIVGFLLFQWHIVVGQTYENDSIVQLPGVKIIAERVDNYTSGQKKVVFDSLTMKINSTHNLGDLISRNTTLQIKNYSYNGLSTISFRGTAAEHTGIYWNGFYLNPSNTNQVDLSLLPTGYFNELKILYGGASSLYGSGNIGGSIYLNSIPEFFSQVKGNVNISAGSYGMNSVYAGIGLSTNKWYSKTQMLWKLADNDFEYEDLSGEIVKQDNANSRQYGLMQDLYRNFGGKYILGVAFWYQFDKREIPPSITTKPSDILQTDESIRSKVSLDRIFTKGKLGFKSAWLHDYFLYHDPDQTTSNVIDSEIITDKLITDLEYSHKFLTNSTFSSGVSFISEQGNSVKWNGDKHQNTVGLYAMWLQKIPAINWSINLNLRQNFTEGYHVPFTPALGLEGPIWRWLSTKFSFSRNFRIPTFNERFWVPGGNENLEPENSWNQEFGLIVNPEKIHKNIGLYISTTIYNSMVDNWIIWIPEGTYVVPENIKKVWSRGIELDGTLNYEKKLWKLALNAGYTYAKSTNQEQISAIDDSYLKQLIYVPEHRYFFNLNINYKLFLLSYNQNYTGIRYTTSDNSESLPAYTIGNVTFGKTFRVKTLKLNFDFQLLNVWDVEYQSVPYYPMPGRNYEISMNIAF